jgi:phosphotransferase system  glucose/maltose/N-acetylglucosamine-specific IIC component
MKNAFILFCIVLACRCFAADGTAAFEAGLKAFQANGIDALLNTWYDSKADLDKIAGIRSRFIKITQDLGQVIDTQVFAPHNLGSHVQKLYGAIYFEKRPLWVRAEYYAIAGRSGLLTLEFSLSPDDILPLTWATNRD